MPEERLDDAVFHSGAVDRLMAKAIVTAEHKQQWQCELKKLDEWRRIPRIRQGQPQRLPSRARGQELRVSTPPAHARSSRV